MCRCERTTAAPLRSRRRRRRRAIIVPRAPPIICCEAARDKRGSDKVKIARIGMQAGTACGLTQSQSVPGSRIVQVPREVGACCMGSSV